MYVLLLIDFTYSSLLSEARGEFNLKVNMYNNYTTSFKENHFSAEPLPHYELNYSSVPLVLFVLLSKGSVQVVFIVCSAITLATRVKSYTGTVE